MSVALGAEGFWVAQRFSAAMIGRFDSYQGTA
jgi:hypothetical protein